MSKPLILNADSDVLYQSGRLVDHASEPDGGPDVGLSVGLGGGAMLYAGDVYDLPGDSLAVYTQTERLDIASDINRRASFHALRLVAAALAERDARIAEFERILADPNAVHINMLRGTIARPSIEQVRHLYPEEFAAWDARIAALEAERERLRDVAEHAEVVSRYLSEYGASVVSHLLDTDDMRERHAPNARHQS